MYSALLTPYSALLTPHSALLTPYSALLTPQMCSPQIFADNDRLFLINGVEPGNSSMPFSPGGYTGDWSYTHIQEIGRGEYE
jgi:hypothetical protein